MATSTSLGAISRTLCRTLLSIGKKPYLNQVPKSFFSTVPSATESDSDFDDSPTPNSDTESPDSTPTAAFPDELPSSSPESPRRPRYSEYSLEGGLDVGIFKAILVGQVGQVALQKRLKNGQMVTLTTIGTGGIKNERIPFTNEEPREYADRCNVQWHRVAVYSERLGEVVRKNCQPGVTIYVEGNLETKIFTDQVTGLVRRVREIAVRGNGRVVFLGSAGEFSQPSPGELKGVGYF